MTQDRTRARRDFLRLDPVVRARQIADCLGAIRDMIVDDHDAGDVLDRIDACSWLIEWAVPHEEPAIQSEMVELQTRLNSLRSKLTDKE